MSQLDKILERARALQTLRDRASNRHESEAAARALAGLLDKHQLAEAAIPADASQEPQLDKEPLYTYRRVIAWKMLLARVLGTHYGVAVFRQKTFFQKRRRAGSECGILMAGRPDDIAIVRYMFAWLSVEGMRLLNMDPASSGRAFRQSYMTGFVAGIKVQLVEARKVAWAGASSTALAVLQSREERAVAVAESELTIRGKGIAPPEQHHDTRGYLHGFSEGRKVPLDDTLPAPAPLGLPERGEEPLDGAKGSR